MMRSRTNIRAFVSPALVALLWELLVALGILSANYLPPPSQVGPHLIQLLAAGELWRHLSMTLYRLCFSFAFALIPAVLLGLGLGMSRNLRLFLEAALAALSSLSKNARTPL